MGFSQNKLYNKFFLLFCFFLNSLNATRWILLFSYTVVFPLLGMNGSSMSMVQWIM